MNNNLNKEYFKKYYQITKDKFKERHKNYYLKNKNKINKYNKEYYKEYYKNNKNKFNEYYKKYYKDNKDKIKEHVKEYKLKKIYNINQVEYNQMLKNQNNVCKICLQPETIKKSKLNFIKSLSVDHDHKTGKIRGLLCSKCNSILGYARDNVTVLRNAANYIENYAL